MLLNSEPHPDHAGGLAVLQQASGAAKNPVDPFIDPEGYRAFIDAAEAEFRSGRMH